MYVRFFKSIRAHNKRSVHLPLTLLNDDKQSSVDICDCVRPGPGLGMGYSRVVERKEMGVDGGGGQPRSLCQHLNPTICRQPPPVHQSQDR